MEVILLDTHVVIWMANEPRRLSQTATRRIQRAVGRLAVCSITLFELARLFSDGHLKMAGTVESSLRTLVEATGVNVREVTIEIAAQATQFAGRFPGDPADRLIAATSLVEKLPLVTADERLRRCEWLTTVW